MLILVTNGKPGSPEYCNDPARAKEMRDLMLKRLLRAALVLVLFAGTAASVRAQPLPGIKRDLDFDAHLKAVDLDDASIKLEYKKPTSDSSSIGVYVGKDGKPPDASFVPTNTSSIPEAEVVSYRLARFLSVSRNYYPVGYYKLGPKAMAQFRDMVFGTPETDDDRAANRSMVMKELETGPDSILGIYRVKPKSKIYATHSLGTEGEFNLTSPLARALRASAPMPSDEPMALEGVKGGRPGFPEKPTESQVELARQLSTIFVIDQLMGQWDRFWANLEASGDKNGRLKLIARDNGGATIDDIEEYDTYTRWVSRYDRELIERLITLNAFLKGEAKDFQGFTSPQAWKEAVGFIKPSSYETFVTKLGMLTGERIPALVKKYGDNVFFPPKLPEVAKLDAADTGEDD
jgi:hypothetical protein